ncbi:nicotinate-nucleotide adenylyltransferase [Futiania mangrovi]|uniref:Probable nicotinate-nucleotide adenylyltransferase n=1 Tax=Futiania mangrovi TaxID=2959716 RepID=A0A9J6PBS8_9PROT|nr:nicotinate-nucleotide adenylyltransferase [Futiania mangrovii]MCP1336709.1 nicotinate-nucleotide adenylyltransferase [Futiania mangrovii]
MRVGVMGGSFNPAHEGHLHASLVALRRLGLDRVVWMVSPQNPLKSARGMAPFTDRFASASAMARHPRILVSDYETHIGTRYTADTLASLTARHPGVRFVWIMGGDNLIGFHRWDRWMRIARTMPVAVVARPGYLHRALGAKFAIRLAHARVPEGAARTLPDRSAPAWCLLHGRLHPASSTEIRAARARGLA